MIITLAHRKDCVECEWWLDESYHPPIKSITLDTEEDSVLLVGKVIGRVKKGVYDISLLSHVNDKDFNKISLFGAKIFAGEKETYLITIYNSSHPYPDIIW